MSLTCCYNDKSDRGKGSVGTQLIGERAKIILDELQDFSLCTRTQCLQHIGIEPQLHSVCAHKLIELAF